MKIVYTDIVDSETLSQIVALGYDTILDNSPEDSDKWDRLQSYGLKAIASDKSEHPTIVAYSLFDEPDLNGISIELQDLKIAEYRQFTDKPLYISCIESRVQLCSHNFDWYGLDIYYNTKTLSKLMNYLNAAFSPQFIRILYPGKTIIPIVGLYDDQELYGFTEEILPFAKFFRNMLPTKHQCTYLYNGGISGSNKFCGILQRDIYKTWAKELNSTDAKCWYRWTFYCLAFIYLKLNPNK